MLIIVNEDCEKCDLCAKKCPVEAISITNLAVSDFTKCIFCMRSVKMCLKNARILEESKYDMLTHRLESICDSKIKNKFF